jgi:hypothetical protein
MKRLRVSPLIVSPHVRIELGHLIFVVLEDAFQIEAEGLFAQNRPVNITQLRTELFG